jgi:hypothetical protein
MHGNLNGINHAISHSYNCVSAQQTVFHLSPCFFPTVISTAWYFFVSFPVVGTGMRLAESLKHILGPLTCTHVTHANNPTGATYGLAERLQTSRF